MDTKLIAEGILEGIKGIPKGLYYGAKRTYITEAALASRRMQHHYSKMYYDVSRFGLDMIYFLVEEQLRPYMDFIHSHPQSCKRINDEICKLVG